MAPRETAQSHRGARPSLASSLISPCRQYFAVVRTIAGVLVCVFALPHAAMGAEAASRPATVVRDSTLIVGNGTVGPYLVTGYYCISGSERVINRFGHVVDTAAYVLDGDRGMVTFCDPLLSTDTLKVAFQRLAFVVPREFGTRAAPEVAGADGRLDIVPVAVTSPIQGSPSNPGSFSLLRNPNTSPSTIRWQGFKSFSLSTSNAGRAEWSQGLELSVDGEIAEGVQMRAAISDRYSDAASSRGYNSATRLGDLDRFYLETESQRFYGRFGQLALNTPLSGATARQATGATLRWRSGDHAVGGYVGRVASQPVRVRLATQSNVAGPYRCP